MQQMTPEEFRRHGHQAVDWIADYLARPERYPVLAQVAPGQLTDALPAAGPECGEPMETILADFERLIVPAVTHWNHPGFMAYFAISASEPGIIGEMLAAALNLNGMLWKSAPAVTELEQVVLRWLRQWTGLPEDWFGCIYDTASLGSMHGIAAARQAADPNAACTGASRRPGGLHLGAGAFLHREGRHRGGHRPGFRAQDPGGRGIPHARRMRSPPPSKRTCAAGLRPCCVCATVGTTSTTSVDPVPAIADLCERYGLWLHVDAAYAGSIMVAPEFRWAFAGCHRADSLVTNPHKWLMTPADCSVFYTRRPEVLREAFSLIPEYLRTNDAPRAVNLMDYGVPLGRRFRALKLWFVMRYYGREGMANLLREHVRLAQDLAREVDADPRFERTAPTPFSVVCLRYKGTDDQNRRIQDYVNSTGEIFISGTVLNGRFTLRLAIGNRATRSEHVERAWTLIREGAERL